MKHIKKYNNFLIKESMEEVELKLYHGGLDGGPEGQYYKKFNKFHAQTSYFTNDPEFAYWYADTKSMDAGLDADRILYTCIFKGTIFDAKNKEDLEKLIPLIPEKVKVHHGTAWFLSGEIPKEEVIKMIQGIETVEPYEAIENVKIGDEIPNPSYKSEKFIVVEIDNDWIYTISKETFNDYLRASEKAYSEHFRNRTKYRDIFIPYRKAIVEWYNRQTGIDKEYKEYQYTNWFDPYLHTYYYSTKGASIDYVRTRNNETKFELTEKDKKDINKIYEECYEEFKKIAFKELDRKKWTRKTIQKENNDYWNYYETPEISDNIKKLGYDGYIAKETFQGKSYVSYAIFRPDETIKIINSERV